MKLHTFVTETRDPHERGRLFGRHWGEQIRRTVGLYLDFFAQVGIAETRVRAIGEAGLETLDGWAPHLAREVEATADAARIPLWKMASVNARTEVMTVIPPVTEGECSTAVYAPAGAMAPRTIQTWDWLGALVPEGLMLQLESEAGHRVKLFTEFGMLGKIGVNSAGLGLHFNILRHQNDNGVSGVPVHTVVRRILEEATSVEQAIAIAHSAPVCASTVLTVFSRDAASPRAACIELSSGGTAVVLPDASGWLTHTNHFLDPRLGEGERSPDPSTTYARLEHLGTTLSSLAQEDMRDRARALCGEAGEAAPICFILDRSLPMPEQFETLLTIGVDTVNGCLDYVAGNPMVMAREGYQRF